MIIRKILHLNQSREQTEVRLANTCRYCAELTGVEKQVGSDADESRWFIWTPMGKVGPLQMTEDQNQCVLFSGTNRHLELKGAVELTSILPKLTEIELTVEYRFRNPVLAFIDRFVQLGDRLANARLEALRDYFAGAQNDASLQQNDSLVFTGVTLPLLGDQGRLLRSIHLNTP